MPVQHLSFHGINRSVSDYAATGSCEELINLRPTTAGLVPVRPFSPKFQNSINCDAFYEHNASNATNYIKINIDHGADDIIATFINSSGTQIGDPVTIADISYQAHITADSIHFASAGNYIVFSVAYKATGNDGDLCATASFLWDGSAYVKREADIPGINVSTTYVLTKNQVSIGINATDENTDKAYLAGVISGAMNKIQEDNKDTCFGPTIVAIAYKTVDGNTFWTNKWMLIDPLPLNISQHNTSNSTARMGDDVVVSIVGQTVHVDDIFTNFYTKHDVGFYSAFSGFDSDFYYKAQMSGVKSTLTLSLTSGTWDKDTSMIKSVEIYASKPYAYVDPNVIVAGESGLSYDDYIVHFDNFGYDLYFIMLPQVQYNKMDLGNQLLYLQKSIPLEQLTDGNVAVDLEFGGNLQVTNKTLEVDSGSVTRYGDILSYNARFHYYDSTSKTDLAASVGFFGTDYNDMPSEYKLFVVFNDGQKERVRYIDDAFIARPNKSVILASDIRVTEVILRRTENDIIYKYRMTPSDRYNYSICVDGPYYYDDDTDSDPQTDAALADGIVTEVFIDEPNAINVTEQYNPFVFNVANSYLAPGKVIDIQPQMVAVTDVSYGDYPLNIYTGRGVYALLQGDGNVLYGAMRPISNLVENGKGGGIPTESGTFFLAAGNLWLIAGRHVVLVSDALALGPHKFIRNDATGYGVICASSTGYNVSTYVSADEFKKYIEYSSGATLSYNRFRDEIYISNPAYAYTYVLSLKYRQWFKITVKLMQNTTGGTIALTPHGAGAWDILDFSNETTTGNTLVHLQTRPLSPGGFQYSHIHRAIQMMRAALTDRFILSVYGSDDLQNWSLICYASRTGAALSALKVSQVRTGSASRSWRYYTVCFGGNVPVTDTDIAQTLLEYQPVIRHIG